MSELFEIFDDTGQPCGTASREEAHRLGLWHRASNVFLFGSDGRLLIQRRQSTKDVCPGVWDLSVAEHLRPGESYEAGAIRGLKEELGIDVANLDAIGSLAKACLEIEPLGIRDCEFQQSFSARFDGEVSASPEEVMETRRISLSDLEAEIAENPERFTPWLRNRASELGLIHLGELVS